MKTQTYPILDVVAGPNGSGKTTFAQSYLVRSLKRPYYLNPDIITAGVSPSYSPEAAMQAGRIFLGELKARIRNRESVSFESTLSGMAYVNLLRSAREAGYFINIYFVFTNQTETNIHRIKRRVMMGGHHIKTSDVRRRYGRSFINFWQIYRHLADDWSIFDNSAAQPTLFCSRTEYSKLSKTEIIKFEQSFLGHVRT